MRASLASAGPELHAGITLTFQALGGIDKESIRTISNQIS